MSGTTEPTPVVEVIYKVTNPTQAMLQGFAQVAAGGTVSVTGSGSTTGGGSGTIGSLVVMTLLTGVGLTAADVAKYWPTNPANAPQSPEGAYTKAVNGKIGGAPYLVDKFGNIVEFYKDSTGALVPVTNGWGTGYELMINGSPSGSTSTATAFNEAVVAQGIFWYTVNSHWTGRGETPGGLAIVQGAIPAFFTQTGNGSTTPNLPAMPAAPTPSAIKPGSSGNVILFGPGQTYTTIAAAVAAANNGDTVQAALSAKGVVFSESVAITKNIVLDGIGTLASSGTATPLFSGGAILDGTALADPSGYAHQLGGLVPMTDCIIKGFEIRGFGIHETSSGLTCGIRNGAAANITVDNCWVHGNQNGLGGGGFPATWTVTNTWLQDNGIGDGRSHNAYFSTGNVSVTLDHVTSTVAITGTNATYATGKTNGGHAIKCRAPSFTAMNFYFAAEDGSPLDLPDGTTKPFSCSTGTMAKSAAAPSHRMLAYGEESSTNGYAGGTLTGVTFDAACPNPFIQTLGGTITATNCTVNGSPITVTGGGVVNGLPA